MEGKIIAKCLTKHFGQGNTLVKAVDGIDFEIEPGELTVILGPSGAGKSTLLNLLGGMEKATSGSLLIDGEDLAAFSPRQLTLYRRTKIGFVFQFYNLMPNLTAKENIELSTELKKDATPASIVLGQVGLSDKADSFPSQLSGGQQQRVSIARAIAKNPSLLLCDEPTGALDYQTGKEILALIARQAREFGKSVLLVTHNSALADMADHLIKLKNGKIALDIHNDHPKDIAEIEW